jgi:hypothetical protein
MGLGVFWGMLKEPGPNVSLRCRLCKADQSFSFFSLLVGLPLQTTIGHSAN